jgi:tetratricopeptide (TPR) repeat protein
MNMKKISVAAIIVSLVSTIQINAQSIQEGINHLYADRDQSAKAVFEKMVSSNPNNLEAVYWLGQTYIAMKDSKAAADLYDKTLQTNGNAPLVLVGKGHVFLLEGKKDEARQMFEAAITASHTRKGDNPDVLNAIGRANIDLKAKDGDLAYAIQKLTAAADRDPKNADIFLNLGDAYRRAHDGGNAVINYDKALAVNPNFARAEYRKAMIYYTQKNWDIYLEDLNKAITIDPKFAPAYYELYYYNLYSQKFDKADEYAKKYIASTDPDIQNDYLVAQTCYVKKDYDCTINTLKNIIAKAGEQTSAKTYKLMAYAYVDKGDTASAKGYIDQYFANASDEDLAINDYILKGQIYGAVAKDDNIVLESYVKAANLDSTYEGKIKTLQEGVDYFTKKGDKIKEAEMKMIVYNNRKTPNPADYFFIAFPLYQGGDYQRADSVFRLYNAAFPDSLYGYYWDARTNLAMDTTFSVEPYLTNMIDGFKKTLEIAGRDNNKDRFKSQGTVASSFLAGIYNNTKKDLDSAIYFVQKGLEIDPSNPSLNGLLQQLQKIQQRNSGKPNTGGKPAGNGGKRPSAKIRAVENKPQAISA